MSGIFFGSESSWVTALFGAILPFKGKTQIQKVDNWKVV